MRYSEDYKSLKITDKEIESIDTYRGQNYTLINSLLELGIDNEVEINSKLQFLPYDKDSVQRALDTIINTYSGMVKNTLVHGDRRRTLYRGTTQEEVERINKSKTIGRFLSTTNSEEMAKGYFSLNWDHPAAITVNAAGDVPFINMADAIEDYGDNWEKETLFAPFTKVDEIRKDRDYSNYKGQTYTLNISKQELPEMEEKDRKSTYNDIVENADDMGKKLQEVFKLRSDIDNIEFQKNRLNSQLSGTGLTPNERKDISDHRNYLEKRESELRASEGKFVTEISDWKSKIISYCKAECREKEKDIEKSVTQEQEDLKRQHEEERLNKANGILSGAKDNCLKEMDSIIRMSGSMQKELDNISNSQKQYEASAGKHGLKYNKWCETEKDKEALNELNNKLSEMKHKIEEYTTQIADVDSEYVDKKDELDKLLSTTKEIGLQLRQVYGQSIDIAQKKELNGFKKSIEDKFLKLKAEAEMKKLVDNEQKIDSKNGFRKLVDRITGQKKVDDFRKGEFQKQKRAINSTINNIESNNQVDDRKRYSVHDMLSKMDEYIAENKDNPALKDDIAGIADLRGYVSKKFRVSEEMVESLRDVNKSTQLVPVEDKKLSKLAKAQMEASLWYTNNGYYEQDKRDIRNDLRRNEDNTAHGVSRINNYIEAQLETNDRTQQVSRNINDDKNQR